MLGVAQIPPHMGGSEGGRRERGREEEKDLGRVLSLWRERLCANRRSHVDLRVPPYVQALPV